MFLVKHFISENADLDAIVCDTTDEAMRQINNGFSPDAALVDFSARGKSTSIGICRELASRYPECRLYLMSGVARHLMIEAVADKVNIVKIFEKPCSIQRMLDQIFDEDGSKNKPVTLGITNFPKTTEAQMSALMHLRAKDPDDLAVRQLYAFSLYTAGKYKDAYSEYKILEGLGVITFLSQYYFGTTCARLCKYSEAIRIWASALELAPHEGEVNRLNERINRVKAMMSVDDMDYCDQGVGVEPDCITD
jgi:tetratricopeptide (TPR) repeat protein